MELLAKKKGGKLVVQNLQRVGLTEEDAGMAADAVVTPEDSQKKKMTKSQAFQGPPITPSILFTTKHLPSLDVVNFSLLFAKVYVLVCGITFSSFLQHLTSLDR